MPTEGVDVGDSKSRKTWILSQEVMAEIMKESLDVYTSLRAINLHDP